MALRQLGRGLVLRAKDAMPTRGGGGGPIKYAPELRQTVRQCCFSCSSPARRRGAVQQRPLLFSHTTTNTHDRNRTTADAPVGRALVGRRPVPPAGHARRRRRRPPAHAGLVAQAARRGAGIRRVDDLGRARGVVAREGGVRAAAVPAGGARGDHVAEQGAVDAGAVID